MADGSAAFVTAKRHAGARRGPPRRVSCESALPLGEGKPIGRIRLILIKMREIAHGERFEIKKMSDRIFLGGSRLPLTLSSTTTAQRSTRGPCRPKSNDLPSAVVKPSMSRPFSLLGRPIKGQSEKRDTTTMGSRRTADRVFYSCQGDLPCNSSVSAWATL